MKFREPNLKCYRNLPELVSSFYRLHEYTCVCPGCCAIRLKRNELGKSSWIISMEDVIALIPEEQLEQILIHLKKKTSKIR